MILPWLTVAALITNAIQAAAPVNPDAAIIQDFGKRVSAYEQLRKDAEAKLSRLKPTESQTHIVRHQHELAKTIRQSRQNAKQGDLFTPEIANEFRRLVGLAMEGPRDSTRIEKSLERAEPVRFPIRVNQTYPAGIPRQSTPPTILANLPPLPPDLEYRVVGQRLALLDVNANLVVDVIPNLIP